MLIFMLKAFTWFSAVVLTMSLLAGSVSAVIRPSQQSLNPRSPLVFSDQALAASARFAGRRVIERAHALFAATRLPSTSSDGAAIEKDLLRELVHWLEASALMRWDSESSYGQIEIAFRRGREIDRAEIFLTEAWAKSESGAWRFPELAVLETERRDEIMRKYFYPSKGSLGQIVFEFIKRQDGQICLLVSEIQPSDGYRLLTKKARRRMNDWRIHALERIAAWAHQKEMPLYAATSADIKTQYPFWKGNVFELASNYVKPFLPHLWKEARVQAIYRNASKLWEGSLVQYRFWEYQVPGLLHRAS